MTNFSAQIDAMNMQAWELVRSDPRQAVSLGKQAYQLATQEEPAGFPYLKGAVEGLRTEARVYLYEGNYEQALELSLNALTLADGIGPLEAQPHILYTIASVYRLLGDLATSLDYYLKQRQASEQLNQRLDIATALVGIGTLYGDQEDYTQAWAYFEQGLSIFEELKNSYWMAHVLNNICYALFKLGDHDLALERGLTCLDICQTSQNQRGAMVVHNSLGQIYLETGKSEQALAHGTAALGLAPQVSEPELEIETLILIGQVYGQIEQYDQAIAYQERARLAAEKYQIQRYLVDVHHTLWRIYKALGQIDKALHHHEQFYRHKEKLLTGESAQKLRSLEVRHRTRIAQQEAEYFSRLYDQERLIKEELEVEVQKRTEALRQAYEKIERLDQTKTDFINVTAHELRTPLTIIMGYAQLLRGIEGKERFVQGIISGANHLLEIINTMLMMAKIDSRALKIYPEPLSVQSLMQNVLVSLGAAIAERQHTLVVDENLESCPFIEGDVDALKLVFSNIIENAIKYTPDGGRILICGYSRYIFSSSDVPMEAVEAVVSDTGIGIAAEALELIFTKFYQAGSSQHHSTSKTNFKGGGPGLGLAIARGIIEAHSGKLWATSPGHDEKTCPGSDFHILLPVRQPQAQISPLV